MSESELVNFHFIKLKDPINGPGERPAAVTDHRPLSISKSSIQKLIASHDSTNLGDPLPGLRPSQVDAREEPPIAPHRLTGAVLDVIYNLPSAESAGPQPEAEIAEEVTPAAGKEEVEQATPEAVEAVEQAPVAPEPGPDPEPEPQPEPELESESEQEIPPSQPIEAQYQAEVPSVDIESADEAVAAGQAEIQRPVQPSALPPEFQAEPHQDDADRPPVAQSPGPVAESEPATNVASDTDSVLGDVQATLNSLADMAKGLTQQKLEAVKQRESLDQLKSQLCEKERLLLEKDEQLRALEARLNSDAAAIETAAEENARALAERSAALKALAETVEARDRSTAKVAETLRQEKLRNDELAESLQRRAEALDEREAALHRKEDQLAEKLKQLVGTKERFRKIVRAFNETVQFNNTLNAISSTALDDSQE
ncbi:hypothetical protein E8F11_21425 [Pseudomonas sp. BN417]|uniref:hypothetical protein n=1 Tax=Pseudomonas sp. BN417 TaxID=2567890 RepID=UPI002458F5BC|nr:hypothetical protein [Pseudomonas sp. BN417]MDH4557704.1 hypothetical protein [Pseudomonas sp. BN417]